MGKNNTAINPERNTIAILSGKGGTGKTSIAVAIGYLLAHCGFKTLLIDLDFFTNGSTFFLCKGYADQNTKSMSELFSNNVDFNGVQPFVVPSSFSMGNLFLLPSITELERSDKQFALSAEFEKVHDFSARLKALITELRKTYLFDYVLIDTRGGTDHTSAGAAFAAESFVLVSEADKPSWHMGELLLSSVRKTKGQNGLYAEQVGFILNKVNLPPRVIESYLQDKWKIPHLGTIQFNEAIIRSFQQSKSPMITDKGNRFNQQIIEIVKRIFVSNSWNERHLDRLSSAYAPGVMRRLIDLF